MHVSYTAVVTTAASYSPVCQLPDILNTRQPCEYTRPSYQWLLTAVDSTRKPKSHVTHVTRILPREKKPYHRIRNVWLFCSFQKPIVSAASHPPSCIIFRKQCSEKQCRQVGQFYHPEYNMNKVNVSVSEIYDD